MFNSTEPLKVGLPTVPATCTSAATSPWMKRSALVAPLRKPRLERGSETVKRHGRVRDRVPCWRRACSNPAGTPPLMVSGWICGWRTLVSRSRRLSCRARFTSASAGRMVENCGLRSCRACTLTRATILDKLPCALMPSSTVPSAGAGFVLSMLANSVSSDERLGGDVHVDLVHVGDRAAGRGEFLEVQRKLDVTRRAVRSALA